MIKEPNYTIDEVTESGLLEIIIKNNKTKEFLSIIPEYGGRLKELWLNNGEKNISIIKKITRTDSVNRDDIFANAKLSPFAGRIRNGQYVFDNTKYNLTINYPEEGNACHGFIYGKKFSVIDKTVTEEKALCRLEYLYESENEGYPFNYLIEITYVLSSLDGLTCKTKVVNKSRKTIPISDGWHHYFDLGINLSELSLKLNVSNLIELDSQKIPNGKKSIEFKFNDVKKIENQEIDSCFQVESSNGRAETRLIYEKWNLDLRIWQETGPNKYNYIVIYTPPDRKSIAVEPLTSNIDCFNNREGLILLKSGEEYISDFGIYLNNDQTIT